MLHWCKAIVKPLDFPFNRRCYLTPFISHYLPFPSFYSSLSRCLPTFFKHCLNPLDLPNFLFLGLLLSDHSIYSTFPSPSSLLISLTLFLPFNISSSSNSFLHQHFYPSITHLSESTATDACRHAEEKTHFLSYCHVSEIKELCVCLYMCVCACLRFKGTFIIKFHFLCRQTLLPAGVQTRGNERERMSVCRCAHWLLRAGIRMHWLLFCFYFYLFVFSPTTEERSIEHDTHIGFFSHLKLL